MTSTPSRPACPQCRSNSRARTTQEKGRGRGGKGEDDWNAFLSAFLVLNSNRPAAHEHGAGALRGFPTARKGGGGGRRRKEKERGRKDASSFGLICVSCLAGFTYHSLRVIRVLLTFCHYRARPQPRRKKKKREEKKENYNYRQFRFSFRHLLDFKRLAQSPYSPASQYPAGPGSTNSRKERKEGASHTNPDGWNLAMDPLPFRLELLRSAYHRQSSPCGLDRRNRWGAKERERKKNRSCVNDPFAASAVWETAVPPISGV